MLLPRRTHLALLALLLPLAGCGDDPTMSTQRKGEVAAVLIDDPGSPAPDLLPRSGARLSVSRALIPAGRATVEATVTLLGQGAQELVPDATGGTVDLGSTSKSPLSRADVSSTRYTTVRVAFNRVQANVTEGLTVNGVDVTGTVSVSLPQPAVIEKAIDLVVVENGHHEVEIDLNAESWLTAVDPVTRTVPSSAFRTAVTLEARQ